MNKSLLAGLGLLSIAAMGSYTGGGSSNPDRHPISSEAIESILQGAPVQDEYSTLSSRARMSMTPLKYRFSHPDTGRTLELSPLDGWLWSYGGTDPARTTNDGINVKRLSNAPGVAFTAMRNMDSTEHIVVSNELGRVASGNDAWYYIKFSMTDPDGATRAFGLWGGLDPHSNSSFNLGSPFENSGTAFSDFDGVINDSVHMVAFLLKEGHSSPADTVFIHVRKDAVVEETAVGLDDTVGIATNGTDQEWAFHVFGRDSLQYSLNGQTGSVDISSVFAADSNPMRAGIAAQAVTAGAGNLFYFQTFWGAFGPR